MLTTYTFYRSVNFLLYKVFYSRLKVILYLQKLILNLYNLGNVQKQPTKLNPSYKPILKSLSVT